MKSELCCLPSQPESQPWLRSAFFLHLQPPLLKVQAVPKDPVTVRAVIDGLVYPFISHARFCLMKHFSVCVIVLFSPDVFSLKNKKERKKSLAEEVVQ